MRCTAVSLLFATACAVEGVPLDPAVRDPIVLEPAVPEPPVVVPVRPGVDGLVLGEGRDVHVLGFAPDGRRLAYVRHGRDLQGDLHVVDVVTGADRVIDRGVVVEIPTHPGVIAPGGDGLLYRRAEGASGVAAFHDAPLRFATWDGAITEIGPAVQRNAFRFGGGDRYVIRIQSRGLWVLDRRTGRDVEVHPRIRTAPHRSLEANLPLTGGGAILAFVPIPGTALHAYRLDTEVTTLVHPHGDPESLEIDGDRVRFHASVEGGIAILDGERASPPAASVVRRAGSRFAVLVGEGGALAIYDLDSGRTRPVRAGSDRRQLELGERALYLIDPDGRGTGALSSIDLHSGAYAILDDRISAAAMFYGMEIDPAGRHLVYQRGGDCQSGAELVVLDAETGARTRLDGPLPCVDAGLVEGGSTVLWTVHDGLRSRAETHRFTDGVRRSLGGGTVWPGPDAAHAIVTYPGAPSRMVLRRWSDGRERLLREGDTRVLLVTPTHALVSSYRVQGGGPDLVLERLDMVDGTP